MLGPKGIIKKHEFVRIIIQCMLSLGYTKSAACLESESGISYKSAELDALESLISGANWDSCISSLNELQGLSEEVRASAVFLVFKQRILECLNNGESSLALEILRKQIAKIPVCKEKVHKVVTELISVGESGFLHIEQRAEQGLRRRLLIELEKVLPPPIIVPERRLEHLVEMSVSAQIDNCMYHNSNKVSLYEDHHCSQDEIPRQTIQILTHHENEVWFVQFSNNGEYLASSSSDCTTILWKVLENGKLVHVFTLKGHQKPVSSVAWSPDDSMLLTCGNMEVLKLWDVQTGTCKHTYGNDRFTVSSCAWFPDSKRLVCGSLDPEKGIYMWDSEGNKIKAWKGIRMPKVTDLAVTSDAENLISIFCEKEIHILNLKTNAEYVISEEHSITSLSLSADNMFLIVNLNSQEIHMWDVERKWSKPQKYKGHVQHKYVIRSCFGGLNDRFIASGSEDSKVYIWNTRNPCPIKVLSGHVLAVNSVSWNPKRPEMLASASDDQTIRIWGPNSFQ